MAVKHEFGAALDALLQPERERYCHIKKAAHRLSVLEELITTERHYLEDLRLLVNVWQIEIAKTSVLTQQETNLVFDRLPQMVVLSSELLEDLVQIQTAPSHEQLVGSCFLKRLPFFRLYIEFTLRQAQAATSEILLNAKKHSKLAALLMKMLEKPELKGLGLEDYLIKPAQRIMKYPLLIKDLIENTEHAHPDYGNLVQALNEMEQLLTDINNEKKKWETVQLLSKLQPNMAWRKDAYDLLSSNCQLLCHGQMEIVVVSSDGADKGDEAYMFDACTLICRARAGKWDEMALFLTDDISFEQDPNSATFVMRSKSRTDNFAIFHPPDKLERQRWLSVFTQARKLHTERPKKLVCGGTPDQARKSHKKFSAFKPKRLSVKSEEGEQMLHRTSVCFPTPPAERLTGQPALTVCSGPAGSSACAAEGCRSHAYATGPAVHLYATPATRHVSTKHTATVRTITTLAATATVELARGLRRANEHSASVLALAFAALVTHGVTPSDFNTTPAQWPNGACSKRHLLLPWRQQHKAVRRLWPEVDPRSALPQLR
eukprot:TRINITY_DN4657_c0_g1_i5.p1 TRINITY_DN4657_c0_g1~~TRINITY_DN4657_c0_g1_i5.p1  ORF type:complete len:638 (-),score=116.53 TRINITY_DN4657_c0_g1_i5:98-1735(-)